MSLQRAVGADTDNGFPRVSGDEPYGSWIQTIEFKFSPRERG